MNGYIQQIPLMAATSTWIARSSAIEKKTFTRSNNIFKSNFFHPHNATYRTINIYVPRLLPIKFVIMRS